MQLSLAFCLATVAQTGPATEDFTAVAVTDLTPTTAEIADAIHVVASFGSVGSTFTGSVAVAIVASGDAQYDSLDPVIHTAQVAFPGGTLDATFPLHVPPGRGVLPNTPTTVFVVIDPADDIPEVDETNNVAAAPNTLNIRGPDVRITSLEPDPNVFIGRPFTVRITLANEGNVDARDFQYRYYASRDAVIRIFDTALTTSPPLTIPSGETVSFVDTVDLPPTFTSTGTWYIGAQADIFADLLETNLVNNTAVARPPVRILYPIPDLTAEIVSTSTSGAAGEDLALTRILSNIGPADANSFSYAYFLSTNETLDPSDVPLGTFTTAINEAQFDYGVDIVRIPSSVSAGDYYVLLQMDGDERVEEVDETNNVAVGPELPIYEATVRITTTQLPSATVGVTYEVGLYASGGPLAITWSVVDGALPDGIELDPSGLLLGTPTTEGLYEVTLRASSGTAHSERKYPLRVLSPTVTPTFALTSLAAVFVGRPFCQPLIAVGGQTPYTWRALTALPPGATLSEDGQLCGTIQAAGAYRITFEVTDAVGATATKVLTLHVLRPSDTVQILQLPLPTAVVGDEFCDPTPVEFTAEGGLEPYRWSTFDGEVPGLELFSDGTLCGTPTRAGLFPLTVRVQDETQVFDTALFLVEVASDRDFVITTGMLPDARVGSAFDVKLSVINGQGDVTWSVIERTGELPPGLALMPDGRLAGTPTEDGIFAFAVRAEDSSGQSDLQPLSIRITEAESLAQPKTGCTNTSGGGDGWWVLLAPLAWIWRRRRA